MLNDRGDMMSNDKTFKTYKEQKMILESRNLIFEHPRRDLRLLSQNNYYFLTGYKDLLLSNKNPEIYRDNATFEELYNLYMFDKKLRMIFLDIILEIEQNVKTTIAYEVSKNHGNKTTSYTNKEHYDLTNKYVDDTIFKIKKQLSINGKKNVAIIHYKKNHGYVPLWVGVKILTFGVMHNLYSILKPNEKDYVSKSLLTIDICKRRARTVNTYLQMLVDARNMCAHDEIFFNFLHGSVKIPVTSFHNYFNLLTNRKGEIIQGRKDLLALMIVIKHFVNRTRYKVFIKQINTLINRHMKHVNSYTKTGLLVYMHLPEDFEKIGLI